MYPIGGTNDEDSPEHAGPPRGGARSPGTDARPYGPRVSPAGAPGTGPRRGRRTGPVRGQDGPPHDGATPAEPDVPADALSAGLLAGGLLDGPLGATDRAHDAPDTDAPKSPGTDPVAAGARPAAPGRRAAGPRDDARIDDLAHRAAAGERNALHELLRLVDPLV